MKVINHNGFTKNRENRSFSRLISLFVETWRRFAAIFNAFKCSPLLLMEISRYLLFAGAALHIKQFLLSLQG